MKRVYFDNAATSPLEPEVIEVMTRCMHEHFGNPSSIHMEGRTVRTAIESARKTIAEHLGASIGEIFFTSGGTEANNMAIKCAVRDLGVTRIISSSIEHHCVSHTVESVEKYNGAEVVYINLDSKGHIDYDQLEALLQDTSKKTLVSLMHANNEIGNVTDIDRVGELCEAYDAIFHSDTVQTVGHFRHDLQQLKAHFIVGSAHKLHGPKGVGFLYVRHDHKIPPFIHGGAQERNMRGGTENVYGIVGMAKALEISYQHQSEHRAHIEGLKARMIAKLKEQIEDIHFNGTSGDIQNSLYTVLNVCLPPSDDNDMLLFNLDINGISASGGSACSSGSNIGSHVLAELKRDQSRGAVRFSFSKYTTNEEVDYAVEKLAEIVGVRV